MKLFMNHKLDWLGSMRVKDLFVSSFLGCLVLMGVCIAQTKPVTSPVVPAVVPVVVPVPKSTGTQLIILDSTYLWNNQTNSINAPGLGIGTQCCPLIGLHSGEIRDSQGAVVSRRPMLEPAIDIEVLAAALKPFPKNGIVVLDAEDAGSYSINEAYPHSQNVKGFSQWKLYIEAVKFIRPDLKIYPIMGGWHSPNLNPINAAAWAENDACAAIFKKDILPLIESLAIELYYFDRTSPPSHDDSETFNMFGDLGTPGYGFRFNCCVEHQYARALTGKPPVHVFCITPGDPSRPETSSKFLSGSRMAACLDQIALYQPAAVCLWGSANYGPATHALPDHYTIGVFNPDDDWVKEVAKRKK